MQFPISRVCTCLVIAFAFAATTAYADDDDDAVMMAQLAKIKQQCQQKHEESKQKEQELEAAKANASLPPEQMQAVQQKIETLKTIIAKTDELLAKPMPQSKAEQESYLKQLSGEIAVTRGYESAVARDLNLEPKSHMEEVLAKLGTADDYRTKFGAFDRAAHAYNPDLSAPVVQGPNSNFFGIAASLPPSAIPQAQVTSNYVPTTVEAATKISNDNHGMGGGIMLEGTASGLPAINTAVYDGAVNALLLNGDVAYFVKIPPWSLATMCREIATDRNALLGVSETATEGLVFGDKPEIYKGSDLAYELMLADKFLGEVVFARHNGWTRGYNFPDRTPQQARVTSDMLVRFAFNNYQFSVSDGVVAVASSSLEVRLMPVSKAATPTGQMLPNYNALDKGYTPPDAFLANAQILTDHVDYFRREPLIETVFADGETAAVLRALKASGQDLNALADQIETGGAN